MCFLHVWFCSVSVRETELWLTCSVRFGQNRKKLLRSVTSFHYWDYLTNFLTIHNWRRRKTWLKYVPFLIIIPCSATASERWRHFGGYRSSCPSFLFLQKKFNGNPSQKIHQEKVCINLIIRVYLGWRRTVRLTEFLAEMVFWEFPFFHQKWQ